MVPFSVGFIEQKVPLVPKSRFSQGFSRYILSGFSILPGLCLKRLGLNSKFNSVLNGGIFRNGDRTKSGTCAQNNSFFCPHSLYYLDSFSNHVG